MHQLSILNSSEIPQLPDFHIILNDQWKELIVDYKPVKDTGKPHDPKTADKSYLINTIKYYSKYHGKEIDSFVESKYLELISNDSEFILNKPASFIQFVDEGITYGIKLKKEENLKKLTYIF